MGVWGYGGPNPELEPEHDQEHEHEPNRLTRRSKHPEGTRRRTPFHSPILPYPHTAGVRDRLLRPDTAAGDRPGAPILDVAGRVWAGPGRERGARQPGQPDRGGDH